MFNTSPVSPRKCRILLTKIALLLFTGEKFPTNEATSLFFGISKLFQNKDASLRQMVYLVIKELANTAEDVIMVTSSIMKDTAVGSDVVYRANAIRALCRIIDVSWMSEMVGLEKCILRRSRHRLCKPLNVTSRPRLWTKYPRSHPPPWFRHITFSPSRGTSSGDGRAKHRRLHLRASPQVDSWVSEARARIQWLPPTQIT